MWRRRERRIFSARRMPTDAGEGRGDVLRIEVDYEDLFAPYQQTLTTEYGIFITDGGWKCPITGRPFLRRKQRIPSELSGLPA